MKTSTRDYFLRSVGPDKSFKLKRDHDEYVMDAYSLEGLRCALGKVSDKVIVFHMRDRNDFAAWIGDVFGSDALRDALADVKLDRENLGMTRNALLKTLDLGINMLKE